MKKLILFLLLLVPCTMWAQSSMTAVFDSSKEMIDKGDNSSSVNFTMMATEDEMNYAKEEAAKYNAYMTFEVIKEKEGVYSCKLSFNHVIHHAYIHKMLVAFAVEKFSWNNQFYGLNQWFEVFKM